MALVDVTPTKLVQVLVDDTWYPGELRAWQKRNGRWRGDVTYTIDVGLRKLGWFDQEQLLDVSVAPGPSACRPRRPSQ